MSLALWPGGPESVPRCGPCGAPAFDADEIVRGIPLCETCWLAWSTGRSVEEARLEVEDAAHYWTQRLSDQPCTCGTVSAWISPGAVVDLDVRHAPDCPKAPPEFDWSEINEEMRQRVFGYDGREHHFRRLAAALREILEEREVLET